MSNRTTKTSSVYGAENPEKRNTKELERVNGSKWEIEIYSTPARIRKFEDEFCYTCCVVCGSGVQYMDADHYCLICQENTIPIERLRLRMEVEDPYGKAWFEASDEVAEDLVHRTSETILKMKQEGAIAKIYEMLYRVLDREIDFHIKLNPISNDFPHRMYTVQRVNRPLIGWARQDAAESITEAQDPIENDWETDGEGYESEQL